MELLAPAGSIPALRLAVNAGADAVYLGLSEHNARIKSNDFNTDNLSEWVDYCHLYKVKVYVTLNTSVKDCELERIKELIIAINESNADAIIATDIAVILMIKNIAPNLPIHASTQAGVHNLYGAKFFEKLGVDRIVLARETKISDIVDIKNNTKLEIEFFAHGALCVSFSGGCLLSSISGALSGNRGRCMQPCRKLYKAYDTSGNAVGQGYLLSTADLSSNEKIFDLEKAGVASIKIEGRLKRAEYVGVVVDYYRKLLDGKKADVNEIKKIFVRGDFVKEYGSCSNVIYKYTPNHIGVHIGQVVSVETRKGFDFAEIKSNYEIKKGDGLKIMRNNIECGGSDVTSVKNMGANYIVPVSRGVKIGDEVRLTTEKVQLDDINKFKKKLNISVKFIIEKGKPVEIIGIYGDISYNYFSETPALEGNITDEQIINQLSKTNDTPFIVEKWDILNNGGYLPKSELNYLRRIMLKGLEEKIIASYIRNKSEKKQIVQNINANKHSKIGINLIEIQNEAQLDGIGKDSVIIINPIHFNPKNIIKLMSKAKNVFEKIFVKMPKVMREEEYKRVTDIVIENNYSLLADNIGAVEFARENNLKYIAGMGLNIYNDITFEYYSDAEYIVISPEIGKSALLDKGGVIFAAGRLPLMTLLHCPLSVVYGTKCVCNKRGERLSYSDGKNNFQIIPTVSKNCQFTLYNGIPHNILSKITGMGYNKYINLLNFTNINELCAASSTLAHYKNEVI